ncbi:hypothetical protein HZC32_02750 [Candidatus Woesearchaeota archaeon]|nr:hypothetical protein [Candidatus Woesearchaeota archaeon]
MNLKNNYRKYTCFALMLLIVVSLTLLLVSCSKGKAAWSEDYRYAKIRPSTPKISTLTNCVITGTCIKIAGDGKPGHLDIVFVAENYTISEINLLKEDLTQLILGIQNAPVTFVQKGFLRIKPLRENSNKINIYFINKSFISGKTGYDAEKQLFSLVKSYFPEFSTYNEGTNKDIIIVLNKEEAGNPAATYDPDLNVMTGIVYLNYFIPESYYDLATLAHEFGHAFADLNDEYFWPGSFFPPDKLFKKGTRQTGFGSSNCDLHIEPEIWCESTDQEKYQQFKWAANLSQACYSAIKNKESYIWYKICPQLNLSGFWGKDFEAKVCNCNNLSVLLETKQIIVDGIKTSVFPSVACYENTLKPLKYINLGKNCKPGYGYYFGCGTAANAFRSVPYSIMGCGDADDCNKFYYIYPSGNYYFPANTTLEFSPPAREQMKAVFNNYS